jgi:hypothetical protein
VYRKSTDKCAAIYLLQAFMETPRNEEAPFPYAQFIKLRLRSRLNIFSDCDFPKRIFSVVMTFWRRYFQWL